MEGVASGTFCIPQDFFQSFHSNDRALFTILVIYLCRDLTESMYIVALLLWLEKKGFSNAVKNTVALPNILITELADEATKCLNCVFNNVQPNGSSTTESSEMPYMQKLLGRPISMQFFYENRLTAHATISDIIHNVCLKAFPDIFQKATLGNLSRNNGNAQSRNPHANTNSPPVRLPDRPAFPGMRRKMIPIGQNRYQNQNGSRIQNRIVEAVVPPEERTLFVTFSKGYPVFEWEVIDFFTRAYGDCIESLYMQEVQPNEQSLFARVVFRSNATIELILDASGKAKFVINGKHVWARKFVPKRNKTVHPSPQPHNLPSSFPF